MHDLVINDSIAAAWLGVHLSDADLILKCLASIAVIGTNIYVLHKQSKKNQ